MKMRIAKILDAKTITSDGVEVINLFLSEVVSALYIEAKCLNNGSAPTAHACKAIPKVEILDGSTVIHSLSAMEIQARQFYGLGKFPENVVNYQDNVYFTVPLVIPFGRYLGDPKYALDPARFRQPQIRITVDIGAGGSACDAVILDIDALVFDEKAVAPEGYLSAKEYYRYSLVSSAIEDIDLPRDRKLRSLMIQSAYAGKYPYEQYNAFKLTEDNDRRIPFDLKTSHYIKYLAAMYGKLTEHVSGSVDTSGVALYVAANYEVFATGIGQGGTALYFTQTAGNGGTVTLKGNAAGLFQGLVSGCVPHGAILLPFGDQQDPDDWYDLTKIGSLKLKLAAGASVGSGSDCGIVTESVEPY
jgi:hypothetical protein